MHQRAASHAATLCSVLLAGSAWSAPAAAAGPSTPVPAVQRAGVHADARGADVAAIHAETRRWIAAFRAHDLDALMDLYWPDAQVALHGQPKLVGRDAVRAYFAPALAARPDVEFLLDIEDVRVAGDFGYLISKYWYTSRSATGTYQDAGRSLLVYRRDPNRPERWLIAADIDQGTPDVAFPPPASAR